LRFHVTLIVITIFYSISIEVKNLYIRSLRQYRSFLNECFFIGLTHDDLKQRSRACGPRTSRKMKILKEILGQLVYFLNKHWILTLKNFLLFQCCPPDLAFSLMRPARHLKFETPDLKNALSTGAQELDRKEANKKNKTDFMTSALHFKSLERKF